MRGVIGSVVFLLFIIVSWSYSQTIDHVYVSEGQVTWLECDVDEVDENNLPVTWTKDSQALDTSRSRFLVRGAMLWFLPAEKQDSGIYACSESPLSPVVSMVCLSVESEQCPQPSEIRTVPQGTNETLLCRQDEISQIALDSHVSWMKDCKPIDSVTFINITPSNEGNYTCVVNFTHQEKSYLASRTVQLQPQNEPPAQKPKVIYPLEDSVYIFPDQPANLTCIATLGYEEETVSESLSYWTVNNSFIDQFPGINMSKHVTIEKKEDGMYHSVNILIIPVVPQEFFHLQFQCKFTSPVGEDYKDLWPKPLYHKTSASIIGSVLFVAFAIVSLMCFSQRHRCSSPVSQNETAPLLAQTNISLRLRC